jgi:hypothetical protein
MCCDGDSRLETTKKKNLDFVSLVSEITVWLSCYAARLLQISDRNREDSRSRDLFRVA